MLRVSRFHYTDLQCLAWNDRSGDTQKIFDRYFGDETKFEIVETPEPGDFLIDLSICFMYPHQIKFNPLEEKHQ